jgi:hypothetical protein
LKCALIPYKVLFQRYISDDLLYTRFTIEVFALDKAINRVPTTQAVICDILQGTIERYFPLNTC